MSLMCIKFCLGDNTVSFVTSVIIVLNCHHSRHKLQDCANVYQYPGNV